MSKTSLKNLIKSLKLDYVNPNITEINFPNLKNEAKEFKEFKVFQFDRSVSSGDAIKEMKKEGYIPADLRQLLIWGVGEWKRKDHIIALGSVWQGWSGYRYVPYLWRDSGGRCLNLSWFEDDWLGHCRFLAFKLDSGMEVEKVDNPKKKMLQL